MQSLPLCRSTAEARDPLNLFNSSRAARNGPTRSAKLFSLLDTTMALAYHSIMEPAHRLAQPNVGHHDPCSRLDDADLAGVQFQVPWECTA